jgi:hypothetical protein
MSIRSRVLPFLALAAVLAPRAAAAQSAKSDGGSVAKVRDDRFKWFFGAEGGAMFFKTQTRTTTGIPTVGAHIEVVSRRAGLTLGVDQGFGSTEETAFLDLFTTDTSQVVGARRVTFDKIRRWGFTLTGYPVRGHVEPYLGLGFGLTEVVGTTVYGPFFDQADAAASLAAARSVSTAAFASLMGGLQFRVGRLAAFGQYQINTSPAENTLLRGPMHLLTGGLRWSLGSAREDVKGGGY